MELRLDLRFNGLGCSTAITGNNVAELMQQIPETTNALLRYLNVALKDKNKPEIGVIYERKDGKEIALVRQSSGVDDAGSHGEQVGSLEPPAGL